MSVLIEIDPVLLAAARAGDALAFEKLVRPHRRALEGHCYRMLGSLADAEDAVQDTLVRAWRGLDGWQERASLRTWLFRIATNAAIDFSNRRGPRAIPNEAVPALGPGQPPGPPSESDPLWLDPAPEAFWQDGVESPEAVISARESVGVAFLAAIQRLPASQRAVLLLRDVLGWSASETADLLELTVPAVNSALQRARATLEGKPISVRSTDDATVRSLLSRYVNAWESGAPDAFASVLRDDAILSMPPMAGWYAGREAIVLFAAWLRGAMGDLKMVQIQASGGPAIAGYTRAPGETVYRPAAIHVLRFDGDRVAEIHAFLLPQYFERFGAPLELR